MAKRSARYAVIDAFAGAPFKGNPAAVCLLEAADDRGADGSWMQSVAKEFNISATCFISPVAADSESNAAADPRFDLRWFTPVAEIDAFTDAPFKGNPAAVCLLDAAEYCNVDDSWMQSVATEFNISETCFVSQVASDSESNGAAANPRFNLRWFTPVAEVKLCGHGTLAAAHFLLTSRLVNSDVIEFVTKSGLLTAKKVHGTEENFSIELDFPTIAVVGCRAEEMPSIPLTLNGASIISVQKTGTDEDLIIELGSGNDLVDLQPKFDELQRCAGRGVIITAAAPAESGFDFFTRFFCPKFGINEDPVCGSAHCALAPYWSKKLGKNNFIAYMASPRGGRLDLQLDQENQRVRIRGEAVTTMVGNLLV